MHGTGLELRIPSGPRCPRVNLGRIAATEEIERIVNDPLGSIECVIVLVAEMTKTLCDGLEAGSFRLSIQAIIGVRAVDDLAQQDKCGVGDQLVFLQASAALHQSAWLARASPGASSRF